MSKPLRVLLVEDSERDAALLRLYLRRGGFEAVLERVETREQMQSCLESAAWDVVISDGQLPHFSARGALEVLREGGHQLPFLMLSGELEEKEVEHLMRAGAAGCLRKGEMAQVVAAVESVLQGKP